MREGAREDKLGRPPRPMGAIHCELFLGLLLLLLLRDFDGGGDSGGGGESERVVVEEGGLPLLSSEEWRREGARESANLHFSREQLLERKYLRGDEPKGG